MSPNFLRSTLAPVLVSAGLVLTACGGETITDDAAPVSEQAPVNEPSPEDPAETELAHEPIVVYASLELQDDGRVKCEAGASPGAGMNFEYILDAQNGPADESAACVKALISADQDAVRAGQDVVDDISAYLEKDRGVNTDKLQEALGDLEAALVDDWDAVAAKTKTAKSSLSDVKNLVKEKKAAEAEAAKKAPPKTSPSPKARSKPKESTMPADPKTSGATSAILSATNKYRSGGGVASLSANSCAEKWAKSHAKRMASEDSLYHQDLGPIMSDCGARGAGENVAYGQSSNGAAVQAWWNSSGHKKNILDSRFTHMGAAVARSDSGVPYYVQVFLAK